MQTAALIEATTAEVGDMRPSPSTPVNGLGRDAGEHRVPVGEQGVSVGEHGLNAVSKEFSPRGEHGVLGGEHRVHAS